MKLNASDLKIRMFNVHCTACHVICDLSGSNSKKVDREVIYGHEVKWSFHEEGMVELT